MTQDDLKQHLLQLPLSEITEVRVRGKKYKMLAFVVSPDFVGQHDGIRQDVICGHLLPRLTPWELKEFEFVYTLTPDEMASLDRGEKPNWQTEPLNADTGG